MKHKEERKVSEAQVCKCSSINFKSLKCFDLSTNNGIIDYNRYFDEYDKKLHKDFTDMVSDAVRNLFEDDIFEVFNKIPHLGIDSIEYLTIELCPNYKYGDDTVLFNVYFKDMNKEYLLNIISQYRNKFNIYLLDNYGQTEYTLFHGNSDSKIAMEIATNHTSFVNSFVNNKDNEEDDFYFTVCLDFLLSLNSASFPFLKYNLQNSIKNYCNNII